MIETGPDARSRPDPAFSAERAGTGASPDFDSFCELGRDYSVLPVWRELVADTLTPIGAFRAMVGDGPGFLLESVEHGDRWSRFSFVGRCPAATMVARGRQVEVTEGSLPESVPLESGVLSCIESLLERFRSPSIEGLPPLHGGLVGYLGYDVVREIERLPAPPQRRPRSSGRRRLGYRRARRLRPLAPASDPRRQRPARDRCRCTAPPEEPRPLYADAVRRLEAIRNDLEKPGHDRLATPPLAGARLPPGTVRRGTSAELYCRAVEAAQEYIRAGDAFQVVLSQRFDFDLGCDPFEVYRVLRQVNPSPYMFFLRQGGVSVVGASPEPMVQLLEGRVVSRPIVGTRRRGANEEEDRKLESELVENPKELPST